MPGIYRVPGMQRGRPSLAPGRPSGLRNRGAYSSRPDLPSEAVMVSRFFCRSTSSRKVSLAS